MKTIEKDLARYMPSQQPVPNAPWVGVAEFWSQGMENASRKGSENMKEELNATDSMEAEKQRLLLGCQENQMVVPKYDIYSGYSPFENIEYEVRQQVGWEIVDAVNIPVYRPAVTPDEIGYPVLDHWEKVPVTDWRAKEYLESLKGDDDEG